MLRSLVGSEMCIRDSLCVDRALAVDRLAEGVDDAADQLRADRHVQDPACLLYTSDAADDLPCVDLGGRRIIKKKTNVSCNTWM